MAPARANDDEFDSDSESDTGSDFSVTQTQLAVTDGPIEDGEDEINPLVSRIGGRVAWLPTSSIPPPSVAQCGHCHEQMELLVQIFAPLDDSPYDRIVCVWACARAPCQKLGDGCIKAIRVLSHNARWAAKLEKKRLRQEQRAAEKKKAEEERLAKEKEEAARKKVNPFSSTAPKGFAPGGALGNTLFGGQTNPFAPATNASGVEGGQTNEKSTSDKESAEEVEEDDESDDEEEEDQMAEEMAIKASLESKQSAWADKDWSKEAPLYEPALYLSTFAEPSSAARTQDEQKRNKAEMQKLKQSGGVSGAEMKGWEAERYESMMTANVDDVFERFVKRVGQHPKQVVRYEFGGHPIPFHAQGKAYDKLWPSAAASTETAAGKGTIVSGQAFAASENGKPGSSHHRTFSSQNVAKCKRCGSARVCELQLMPNLVNTLRPSMLRGGKDGDADGAVGNAKDAEAERRREIEEALGRRLSASQPDADGITRDPVVAADAPSDPSALAKRTGLRWNTAFVFVCQSDCHDEDAHKDGHELQSWSEELVELQFENEAV